MKKLIACCLTLALATTAFANPPASLDHRDPDAPCFRWPAVDVDGDGVFDRIDRCTGTPKGCTVDQWGCPSDSDGDKVCDGVDRCPDTPPGMKVNKEGCSDSQLSGSGTPAPPVAKDVPKPPPTPEPVQKPVSEMERQLIESGRIRLENVYFETNSARLLPESEETLNEVGATLEKFGDLRFEIEGHTDTRGSAAYNMKLSQSRSETVRAFLLEHFKLDGANYTAKGYGETQPETEERNDEELLRNRRVVLRVLNPEVLPRGVKIEKQ